MGRYGERIIAISGDPEIPHSSALPLYTDWVGGGREQSKELRGRRKDLFTLPWGAQMFLSTPQRITSGLT